MGENRFLYRGIKYNIFGFIPKTSYVTQRLNLKYRGTIEPWATQSLGSNDTPFFIFVQMQFVLV